MKGNCERFDPPTRNELSVALQGTSLDLCFGSTCWTTEWQHVDRRRRDRLSVSYSGTSKLAGRIEQLHMSGSIELRTFAYRMVAMADDGTVDLLFGECSCDGRATGERSCLRGVSK
jgi:hypothetical protein